MANYTLTLQELLEWKFTKLDPSTKEHYIDVDGLFPDPFPIANTTHKKDLYGKIVGHFMLREIGFETPDKFIVYFRQTCLEALPKYNQLVKAFEKDFSLNADKSFETHTENSGSSSTSSNTTSTGNNASQATPYTNYNPDTLYNTATGNSSSSGSATGSGENSGESHSYGRNESEIINARKIADLYIDADLWLINQLDTCFMQVF